MITPATLRNPVRTSTTGALVALLVTIEAGALHAGAVAQPPGTPVPPPSPPPSPRALTSAEANVLARFTRLVARGGQVFVLAQPESAAPVPLRCEAWRLVHAGRGKARHLELRRRAPDRDTPSVVVERVYQVHAFAAPLPLRLLGDAWRETRVNLRDRRDGSLGGAGGACSARPHAVEVVGETLWIGASPWFLDEAACRRALAAGGPARLDPAPYDEIPATPFCP